MDSLGQFARVDLYTTLNVGSNGQLERPPRMKTESGLAHDSSRPSDRE
jgi:hypothetical protein